MSLTDLHFLRPLWLLALLALPWVAWLMRRREARENGWQDIVDAGLLDAQSERAGARSRFLPLVLLASTIAIVALAGPAFRELPQPLIQREAPLAIALSLSPTMHAEDLKPNRLARARFKIADLLRERRDGQFALLAYADDAYTVAPVTDDGQTLLALLDSLEIDVMPKPGNRPAMAIRRAMALLQGAGFEGGDILLVADGVAMSSAERADSLKEAEAAAEAAAAAGFHVSVLGVGSESPGPVPMPGGGFLKDGAGGILLPKLDDAGLQSLSAAGNGAYQMLRSDAGDLRGLGLLDASSMSDSGSSADRTKEEDARRAFQDDGPWLLLLLLPLVAAGFRRGWVASFALLVFLPMTPPPAMAAQESPSPPASATSAAESSMPAASAAQAPSGSSWWKRDDQRAWDALQAGDNDTARTLATDPSMAASAAYRAGDFSAAAQGFAGASADDHYNRGNALARQGELKAAIDAYDQALSLEPGMEDATVNRDLVQQALQQQEQQQKDQSGQSDKQDGQQDPNQQGQQSEQDQQGEQQDQQGESSQDGEQQQKNDPSQQDGQQGEEQRDGEEQQAQSEDGEKDEEAARQDFQQAMEQALKDGEQEQQETRAMTEAEREQNEQQQAVEQWLRRIPDDPGGLLRRKFQIEQQRRQREGDDR